VHHVQQCNWYNQSVCATSLDKIALVCSFFIGSKNVRKQGGLISLFVGDLEQATAFTWFFHGQYGNSMWRVTWDKREEGTPMYVH
jgi:hypothetical protein